MSVVTAVIVVLLIALLLVAVLGVTAAYLIEQAQRRHERQRITQQTSFALMRLRRLQHEAERQMHAVIEAERRP